VIIIYSMLYEVLMVVKLAMSSSLVQGFQQFGGMWYHHLQGRHSSELNSTTSQKNHNLNNLWHTTNVTSKCINTLIYRHKYPSIQYKHSFMHNYLNKCTCVGSLCKGAIAHHEFKAL